ncbi:MAG: ATPase AAA [Candidatus Xenobia bacterium]
MFLDRDRELEGLNERFREESAELFVVYGRRRIGKSALLNEFGRGKPHVYFLASQVREGDNLEQFRQALSLARTDPLLDSLRFHSWETALAYLGRAGESERFLVVLDEFPYLCQENPALPSVLQKWWDTQGCNSKLFLILCGSQVSFMEGELLAERSPLYGRRTGQQRLGPLLPWDAARFFPNYSVRDRLATYGILGGVPAYLERFRPGQSLKANLLREALNPQGFLYDEVHFLLRTELTQIATYLTVLKAVAGGATRISEIADRAGLPVTGVSSYLGTLRELGLIRREVPFLEPIPEKSKRGVYRVADPFIAFWCRFILPYQSLIQAGQGELAWRELISPFLDTHLGQVFEEVCRLFVQHRWAELGSAVPLRVGSQWSGDHDLDVVAELADGEKRELLVGECKWWKGPVGRNVLEAVRARAQSLRSPSRLALFSLNGFTEDLRETAEREDIALIDGEKLVSSLDSPTSR